MVAQGILSAVVVCVGWVLAQNLLMHVRPAENRLRAMALGYGLSLPLVYVAYRWLPPVMAASGESDAMGLGLAYLLHLLLFFQYVHGFYHVERSVTLRFFIEILKHADRGAKIESIQTHYSVDEMIGRRLQVLRDQGFLELREGRWQLCGKGLVLARVARAGAWLFQFKGQHEQM